MANHLRASQSACAESTIHLCGIYLIYILLSFISVMAAYAVDAEGRHTDRIFLCRVHTNRDAVTTWTSCQLYVEFISVEFIIDLSSERFALKK